MAELRDFLSDLATDPQRLGEFIQDPEGAMSAAELSDEDKNALRSGFPAIIYARLAGLPTEQAFQLTLSPPQFPQQFPQNLLQPPPQQLPQNFPQFLMQMFPPNFQFNVPPQLPPQQLPQNVPQFLFNAPQFQPPPFQPATLPFSWFPPFWIAR
jgi:hypothetical protein